MNPNLSPDCQQLHSRVALRRSIEAELLEEACRTLNGAATAMAALCNCFAETGRVLELSAETEDCFEEDREFQLSRRIYDLARRLDGQQHLLRARAARHALKILVLERPGTIQMAWLYDQVAEQMGGNRARIERLLRSFFQAARANRSPLYRQLMDEIPQSGSCFYWQLYLYLQDDPRNGRA